MGALEPGPFSPLGTPRSAAPTALTEMAALPDSLGVPSSLTVVGPALLTEGSSYPSCFLRSPTKLWHPSLHLGNCIPTDLTCHKRGALASPHCAPAEAPKVMNTREL